MTAIAGFVHKDHSVWMGGDSAGVADTALTVRSDVKVFARGSFLIGFAGSFRQAQLVRYKLRVPARRPKQDVHEYLATRFIDSLRTMFTKEGASNEENACGFLVGYAGRLFCVDIDYQVGEALDGLDAVGCGADLVKGALYVTRDWADPKARITAALQAAERHSGGVRAPFTIKVLKKAAK